MSQPAAGGGRLVQGMGREPAEPDWPPLDDAEVTAVLRRYLPAREPQWGQRREADRATVYWHSPRPMSAAGLVRAGDRTFFVKRHDVRVRTARQLAAEHAFATHLRGCGLEVPQILRTARGGTTVRRGRFVYEVHAPIAGADVYQDTLSWEPFTSLRHARAAGAGLARLHAAAAAFPLPARAPAVLMNSCAVVVAADPLAAIGQIAARRPGLAGYLGRRRWQDDLASHVVPAITAAAPLLSPLPRQWGHGDWHPSNLAWTSAAAGAAVAGVFDLGLANRTSAVHDLAIALERSTVSWLDLAECGHAAADLEAMDALLDGYESVRPLTPAEAAALPAVLPVVHVEYALSEVEYFADVVSSAANADLAYDGYLLDHARWFHCPAGQRVLDHLRRRARFGHQGGG